VSPELPTEELGEALAAVADWLAGEATELSGAVMSRVEALEKQLKESEMRNKEYSIWIRIKHKRCECYHTFWHDYKRWVKHDDWYKCRTFPSGYFGVGSIERDKPPINSPQWNKALVQCIRRAKKLTCAEGTK
jgi:hypothetical protein